MARQAGLVQRLIDDKVAATAEHTSLTAEISNLRHQRNDLLQSNDFWAKQTMDKVEQAVSHRWQQVEARIKREREEVLIVAGMFRAEAAQTQALADEVVFQKAELVVLQRWMQEDRETIADQAERLLSLVDEADDSREAAAQTEALTAELGAAKRQLAAAQRGGVELREQIGSMTERVAIWEAAVEAGQAAWSAAAAERQAAAEGRAAAAEARADAAERELKKLAGAEERADTEVLGA
jgi:colicin import membrane protein